MGSYKEKREKLLSNAKQTCLTSQMNRNIILVIKKRIRIQNSLPLEQRETNWLLNNRLNFLLLSFTQPSAWHRLLC